MDLIIRRSGETALVQCKRWKQVKVGAPLVRELREAVARDKATRGIFVTIGIFTGEARAEAQGQPPLELVDGAALLALIQEVQEQKSAVPNVLSVPAGAVQTTTPVCPRCQNIMVLRTSRQGESAGSQFWGCPNFPCCRGTRPL